MYYAVQFDADIQNRTIIIPEKEAAKLPKKVKVILLADSESCSSKGFTFDAIELNTKGFHFNREEANE